MPETGIVIVTYNSAAEIGACLDAALQSGAEVVVVDNASEDKTAQLASRPGVQVIVNPTNLGFAGSGGPHLRLYAIGRGRGIR